jgi:hypothetical protein
MDPHDKLRKYAYCTATDMTGVPSIQNDDNLANALGQYARKQFKDRFGFDYQTTPPELPDSKEASRQQLLQYSEDDLGHTKLPDLVKNYFSGVSLPDNIKGLTESDLETQLKSLARDHVIGDWSIAVFEKTYKRSDPGLNAVRASGIVLYFYRQEATLATTISASYLYILGAFYEVAPLEPIIVKDLLDQLSASVQGQIERSSGTNEADWENLRLLLLQFAKQQFKRSFAFEWDGTDSRIHDGDGRKISFAVLLKLADQLSDQAIEENVRINIFKRDGREFPSASVQAALFDDLLDSIVYLTKSSDLPKDNTKWFDVSHERSFAIDPSKADSDFVKQYTTFVYTVGAKSERDVRMRINLIYYLSVFTKIPFPPLE